MHLQVMIAQRVFNATLRGFDNLERVHPLPLGRDGARVDASHLENDVEQALQPLHFGEDDVRLLAALRYGEPRRVQIAGGDANGRQRRSQIVRQRRQQRRFQFGAALREFGLLPLLHELCTLNGQRGPIARHGRQAAGDQTDRQKRQQRYPILRIGNRERVDRRQKEKVECHHRRDRRRHGNPQTR